MTYERSKHARYFQTAHPKGELAGLTHTVEIPQDEWLYRYSYTLQAGEHLLNSQVEVCYLPEDVAQPPVGVARFLTWATENPVEGDVRVNLAYAPSLGALLADRRNLAQAFPNTDVFRGLRFSGKSLEGPFLVWSETTGQPVRIAGVDALLDMNRVMRLKDRRYTIGAEADGDDRIFTCYYRPRPATWDVTLQAGTTAGRIREGVDTYLNYGTLVTETIPVEVNLPRD